MHTQPEANEDSSPLMISAETFPEVVLAARWRLLRAEPIPGYRLKVYFVDGLEGTVDVSRLISSADAGVFAALADPALFEKVFVEYGVVTWPGEVDLAPDAMYAAIAERGVWVL